MPRSDKPRSSGAAPGPWRSLFGAGVTACLASGGVLTAVTFLTLGFEPAISAALGVAVTTLFFVLGLAALRPVLAGHLSFQLVGALAVYAAQVGLLFVLIDALAGVVGLHGRPFALGGLVAALAWQASQVWVVMRRRTLVFDTPMPGETPGVTVR